MAKTLYSLTVDGETIPFIANVPVSYMVGEDSSYRTINLGGENFQVKSESQEISNNSVSFSMPTQGINNLSLILSLFTPESSTYIEGKTIAFSVTEDGKTLTLQGVCIGTQKQSMSVNGMDDFSVTITLDKLTTLQI